MTVAVPEMCRSRLLSKLNAGRVIPAVGVSVFQSSLLAPVPLARFSSSSPSLIDSVSGSSASERLIPEASTPSQLFPPWVSCTSFKLAPAAPTPPALTEVSSVSASACAPVSVWLVVASVPEN